MNPTGAPSPLSPESRPLDSSLMKQLADNQAKELEIRLIDAQIAKDNSERQFIYATKQLEAQERDRKDERIYKQSLEKKSLCLFVILIIAIAIFLIIALVKDKDQMLIEIVRAVVYCGISGTGGYAIGRYRSNNNNQQGRE